MNVYDFDNTIYNGDSTADFYLFSLKRHKKILLLLPSLLVGFIKFYVFRLGSKTDFKENMYKFLKFCSIERDVEDFWNINESKIKNFYFDIQQSDDTIISASPEFLLKPICKKLNIKHLIASQVDKHTGKYNGINCHGEEKVRRFYAFFNEKSDLHIENFYSDSKSDLPLAKIAEKAYLVKKNKIYEWNTK